MNPKLLGCIVVLVAVAHLAVFQIIDHLRNFGPPQRVPEPKFTTTTFHYQDEKGQDVKVVKEFKVSTTFADPEVLKTLPPPPVTAPGAPAAD
jgi:hypothetical protein